MGPLNPPGAGYVQNQVRFYLNGFNSRLHSLGTGTAAPLFLSHQLLSQLLFLSIHHGVQELSLLMSLSGPLRAPRRRASTAQPSQHLEESPHIWAASHVTV